MVTQSPPNVIPEAPVTAGDDSTAKTPCFRCGVIDRHNIKPGTGPHGSKLVCGHCDSFIRWLPKNPPEVRQANRQSAIQAWMSRQPPTPKQLKFLKSLAYKGAKPASRLKASEAIDALLNARGRGQA